MAKSANPHTILLKQLDQAMKLRSDVYGWINNTGSALMGGKRFVSFGHKGSGDWIGLTADGRFISFECKTGEARQSFEQRMFQEKIQSLGGRYFLIRTYSEAIAHLDKLRLSEKNVS